MEALPEETVLPPKQYLKHDESLSVFKILKEVAPTVNLSSDLATTHLPSTLSYPFSVLEYIAIKRFRGMDMLKDYSRLTNPVDKLFLVTKWYLAMMTDDAYCKRPWIPTIGETFMAKSDDTYFYSEQVQQDPSTSAFHFENETFRYKMFGHASFSLHFTGNSIVANINGNCNFEINGDKYYADKLLPALHANNLLIGSSRNEYGDEITIYGPYNYFVKLEFKMLSKLSFSNANLNRVVGFMKHANESQNVIEFDGHWNEQIIVTKSRSSTICKNDVLHDTHKIKNPIISELRHPQLRSSREVWKKANDALKNLDYQLADQEKQKIENNKDNEHNDLALFIKKNNMYELIEKHKI